MRPSQLCQIHHGPPPSSLPFVTRLQPRGRIPTAPWYPTLPFFALLACLPKLRFTFPFSVRQFTPTPTFGVLLLLLLLLFFYYYFSLPGSEIIILLLLDSECDSKNPAKQLVTRLNKVSRAFSLARATRTPGSSSGVKSSLWKGLKRTELSRYKSLERREGCGWSVLCTL